MKYVHRWDTDGPAPKDVLGGKGEGLSQMTAMKVPVPPGLTVPIPVMLQYRGASVEEKKALLHETANQVHKVVREIAAQLLDDRPTLLSVRSGAPLSMPGMMDTVLNVGITSENYPHWAETLGDRVAQNCLQKFIDQFHELQFGPNDSMTAQAKLTQCLEGVPDFDTVEGQIKACIRLVWDSWDSPRAIAYRQDNGIPDDMGTACNVQSMVFGNLNEDSGTGVVFSRNPTTGEPYPYGEFLQNAQGEDVVAGTATPLPVSAMTECGAALAVAYDVLLGQLGALEQCYRDMQDVEFTVEDGKLWILQTRSGKRTATAAFRIAVDMVDEGMLTPDEALTRVKSSHLSKALVPRVSQDDTPLAHGLGASPGVAVGRVVTTAGQAMKSKVPCILVRAHTSPDDFSGMKASVGVLTAKGGMTSHAAVVARSMNIPCVVGCGKLQKVGGAWAIQGPDGWVTIEGKQIALDGATGAIYVGEVKIDEGGSNEYVERVLEWAFNGQPFKWRPGPKQAYDDELARLPIPKHSPLWVDTTQLEEWNTVREVDFIELLETVRKVLANTDRQVILDVRTSEDRWSEDSMNLVRLVGRKASDSAVAKLNHKLNLVAGEFEGQNLTKLHLVGGEVGGVQSIASVERIGDLAGAKGLIRVTEQLAAEQGLTANQLGKIKVALGCEAQVVTDPMTPGVALHE